MSERFSPSTVPRVDTQTSRLDVGSELSTLMVLSPGCSCVADFSTVVSPREAGDDVCAQAFDEELVAVPRGEVGPGQLEDPPHVVRPGADDPDRGFGAAEQGFGGNVGHQAAAAHDHQVVCGLGHLAHQV